MTIDAQEKREDGQYQVVALKYRPQSFESLVGQSHIATALGNAITQNRVGHAYLFTGARGVGKTSSARIFAKCLNCKTGPTTTPCNECDICQSISTGEDVDVLEIDGASNRGIDEIRQLRSNAAVRPGRSRYKIYIIDEVHMLTMQAFNALLKTLEEPPLHVKFIFCTTDPQKIPITVLSRCQRFDFSPVQTDEIAKRLREIAAHEGVQADEAALALLARRANGSMRDSQSLLEQMFSFCGSAITVAEVHQLLGTADVKQISEVAAAMADSDATLTLNLIHTAIQEGVNAGQLATQLLGYFRDVMAAQVGCGPDVLLTCTAADTQSLSEIAERLGLETILTIVQILDGSVVRMQSSLHARTLLEVAAVRVCNLENLDSISDLVNRLSEGGASPSTAPQPRPAKKKVELKQVSTASKKNEVVNRDSSRGEDGETSDVSNLASAAPTDDATSAQTQETRQPMTLAATSIAATGPVATETQPGANQPNTANVATLEPPKQHVVRETNDAKSQSTSSTSSPSEIAHKIAQEIAQQWAKTLEAIGDMNSDMASDYESLDLQADQLVVTLKDAYHTRECNRPERKQKFESMLTEVAGRKLRVDFLASKKIQSSAESRKPKLSRVQQLRKLQEVDFVKKTITLFDAEIVSFY